MAVENNESKKLITGWESGQYMNYDNYDYDIEKCNFNKTIS
jgi:hypothetical protein